MLDILDMEKDNVIDSPYITVKTTYKYALEELYPLINQLEFQRNPLKKEYYERLKKDIIDGCVMPPITIAFDDAELFKKINSSNINLNNEDIIKLVSENIDKGFILDGIQRLNTVMEASKNDNFDMTRPLYASIILSDSMNKLLYRMIILNNGQRPMSARHQIEILVGKSVSKLNIDVKYLDSIYTEKDGKRNDGLNKLKQDVLSKAFIAFSSSSIDIDNQKIIEEKLNEIISRKIVSSDVKNSKIDLEDLIKYILDMGIESKKEDENIFPWLNNENNLIGFFAGISKRNDFLENIEYTAFMQIIKNIEYVMQSLNVSKIKVSKVRRQTVLNLVKEYDKYNTDDTDILDDYIVQV